MKKSLIALAVASTFAAPAFADTANVDIYGAIKMSYDYIRTDAPAGASNNDKNLTRISSNSSRLGFKGSEDLGGGLKGVWQWELGFDASEEGGNLRNRNTYLGLSGGFGTVLLGVHDTPYKMATRSLDVFGDTMGDYNAIMGSINGKNVLDLRVSNVLAYLSPNFSGLSFALARVNANETGTQGTPDPDAWSAAGMYSNGPLYVALAWEKREDLGDIAQDGLGNDLTAYKLGVGYKFGDYRVGAGFETVSDGTGKTEADRNAFFINGAYMMGAITLKAQYAKADDGDTPANTSAQYFAVGADYKLSKRTKAYALYAQTFNRAGASYNIGGDAGGAYTPNGGRDPSVLSVGVEHSF